MSKKTIGAALSAAMLLGAFPAAADAVSDFYSGKQIRFLVRTTAGGDYDELTRLLARHLGKHIPGHPSLVVQNMPGGGGITAANYMALQAPHDGTVLGIVSQGLAADQALGLSPQLKADLRTFNWIANVVFSNQLLVVWHSSPTKSLEDAKKRETPIGSTGAGSASVQLPAFYNNVLGTRFKIIFGYPGGQLVDLAMESGEVEGRGTNTYAGYMASKPHYIAQKQVIPLIQVGLEKEPALPDVPLLLEQKVKDEDKPLLAFMSNSTVVGRPLATTPGVPADRVAALRAAFNATVKDPEFIADAKTQNAEIRPMTGDALAKVIGDLISAPESVRERVKVALQPKAEQTKEIKVEGAPAGD